MNTNHAIEIIRRDYLLDDKNKIKLTSNIDLEESEFLFNFINTEKSIINVLEIGCGHGISSITISSALENRINSKHTIIDPFQKSLFNDVGIKALSNHGFNNVEIIYDRSERILPNLTDDYDLIFIDGWHTFDQVIIDVFYSLNLLKIGGYIVIDDADFPSVGKAISYFKKCPNVEYIRGIKRNINNASFKRKIGILINFLINEDVAKYIIPKILFDKYYYSLSPTMIILRKKSDDNRPWYFHKIF